MLFESSSLNVKGKSFFVARTMATGIGGPLTSRANTNNVSVADPLPARLGATVTLPLIASDCPADAAGSAYAGTVWRAARCRQADHILPRICWPCVMLLC